MRARAAGRLGLAGLLASLALLAAVALQGGAAHASPLVSGVGHQFAVDALTQQGDKLTADDLAGGGGLGVSVALSADGNTALVGGYHGILNLGAAWVFTRSGGAWTQQGPKLPATGAVIGCCGTQFGASVALSADGNTALVGGPDDDAHVGAAWVFIRSGDVWTQQGAKLTSGEAVTGGFGSSVALSADGNTALIIGHGEAWMFTRSGVTWTRQGVVTDTGGFAASVALSADGNTALIGGPGDDQGSGAGWVFIRSGGSWTQQGPKLTGTRGNFGWSVALSSDGNTALIGGPYDTPTQYNQAGAALGSA